MLSKNEIYSLMDKIIEKSKYKTSISLNYYENGLTRFANSEIHQNVYTSDCRVKVTVLHDKKVSNVSTNLLTEEALIKALRDAEENLDFLPQGDYEYKLPAEPKVMEQEDEQLSNKCNLTIDGRARLVKECIESLDDDFIAAGALSSGNSIMAIANTNGIKRFISNNNMNFSVVVMHKDGFSGYAEIEGNNPCEFDVKTAFKRAYDKARTGINPISIEPGAYDVILEPAAVSAFVSMGAYLGFNGEGLRKGNSFLTGKEGKKVFDERINIVDDWTSEETMAIPFDFEGYERKKVTLIENGVFKGGVYDSRNAELVGKENTGHSTGFFSGAMPLNIVIKSGEKSVDTIIKESKKALLITRFHYINVVNKKEAVLTGLTRDGVFLVEDGEIKCGVKNMRFTESIVDAFNNIEEIAKEKEAVPSYRGPLNLPAMKINNFHLTGKTE